MITATTVNNSTKSTNSIAYCCYYVFLGLLVAIQAVSTVFHASQIIQYTDEVAKLEHQKAQLAQQKIELQSETAHLVSLTAISSQDLTQEYQHISQPQVLTTQSAVASR